MFKVGDKVKMVSSLVSIETGKSIGWVYGEVSGWGDRLVVEWPATGCVTPLPNPNVFLVDEKAN